LNTLAKPQQNMKMFAVAILVLTVFAGTRMNDKTCWRCALSEQVTGRPLPTKDTCTESDPSTFHFYDANGNPLNVTCAKR